MENIGMPKTQVDAIKSYRPYLYAAVKSDAERLLKQGVKGPINSVDEYDSSMPTVLRQAMTTMLQPLSQHMRLPVATFFTNGEPNVEMIPVELRSQFRAMLEIVNYEFHSLLNFELSGQKVFRFADALVEDLVETSSNVKCEFLFLPFRSCLFVTSSVAAINALYGFMKGKFPENLFARDHGIDYGTPLSVFLTELEPKGKLAHNSWIIHVNHGDDRHQYAMAKRQIYLDPSWTVEKALRTDWDKIHASAGIEVDGVIGGSAWTGHMSTREDVTDEPFYTDGLLFFRLLVNMALYVTSTDPDLLPGKSMHLDRAAWDKLSAKERQARRRLAHTVSELSFTDVGSRLPPSRGIKIDGKSSDSDGAHGTGAGGKLTIRFRVRSHWRNQRVGPGRTEIRRTLVRDYEKGPEMAEIVNRHYDVS